MKQCKNNSKKQEHTLHISTYKNRRLWIRKYISQLTGKYMLGVQHLAINKVQNRIEHNTQQIYKNNNKYSREILMHGRSQTCPILHADSPPPHHSGATYKKGMVSRWALWPVLQHGLNPSVMLLNWRKASNAVCTPKPIHRPYSQTFTPPEKQTPLASGDRTCGTYA